MMFMQNYLNELPDDIQDKIWTIVNKNKFSDCLNEIVKSKIELSADSLLQTKPTRVETIKEQNYLVYEFDNKEL